MDLIIIDCEASGLGPESYPIEIGIAYQNGPEGSLDFKIKPHADWTHWNEISESVHNIKREELENGISIYDAVYKLNSQLRDCKVYSDADAFDEAWINCLFDKVGVQRNFDFRSIYELKFNRDVYKAEKTRLTLLANKSPNPEKRAHRAKIDAEIIRKALFKAIKEQ